MNIRFILSIGFILILGGCAAAGKPKTHLIKNKLAVEEASLLHPSHLPKGLMLIMRIGELNTYGAAFGFLGSVYVPPGDYELVVEISFDYEIQDFGGPAWTVPAGLKCYPLENLNRRDFILVKKGITRPFAKLEKGKSYQVRFGFDRVSSEDPLPCTWVEELPNNEIIEKGNA